VFVSLWLAVTCHEVGLTRALWLVALVLMPGFRLFITKIKYVGRKGLVVMAEGYILCFKCKPKLLLSHTSVLEVRFYISCKTLMGALFVSKEN